MRTAEPTQWRAWLRISAMLGVPPSAFWRLSLTEWRALTAPVAERALGRDEFAVLATRFPDKT